MTVRAIGIDPGSRFAGYGVVEAEGSRLIHVLNGVVRLPGDMPFPTRLGVIYKELTGIIEAVRPDCMSVEEVFLSKNAQSALKLGHARGAAILAGVNAGIPVFEYSALRIKQAVVGYGKADKEQVELMVRRILGIKESLNANAADALAAAICHINSHPRTLPPKRCDK